MTTFIAAHHPSITTKHDFTKKADKFFASFGSSRHMRLGNMSLVICDEDLWASVAYEDDMLTYREEAWPNPDYLASYVEGRLSQLDQIEQNLTERHPMRQEILDAIKAERDYNAA